jgi:hypothetical protein
MEKNKEIHELNSTIQELSLYIEKLEKVKLQHELLRMQYDRENDEANSNISKKSPIRTEDRRLRKNVGIYKH